MKKLTTHDGIEEVAKMSLSKRPFEMSDALIDKVAIINFFDDIWHHNQQLPDTRKITKAAMIDLAYENFKVDYSTLYRIWSEAQAKLGLGEVLSKSELQRYIVETAKLNINKEQLVEKPDRKAIGQILKVLFAVSEALPEEKEDRPPLPIPIFTFKPELLANWASIKKQDIPATLQELRARKGSQLLVAEDIDYIDESGN